MSSLVASVLVWACILQQVSADLFDGLPRPTGFKDAPTKAYGKFPGSYLSVNQSADCDWYGFANVNYVAVELSEMCLAYTFRTAVLDLANTQQLRPYEYLMCYNSHYHSRQYCEGYNWGQHYCTVGCFNLGNTTLPITALPSSPSGSRPTAPPRVTLTKAKLPKPPPRIKDPPTISRGHAFLAPPSVVMVAALCAGALAAVQW